MYTPEPIAAAILAYPGKLQALTGAGGDIMAKGGIGVQRRQMPRQRDDVWVHATDLLLMRLEQPGLEISGRVDPAIQPSQRILATLGKHHGMLQRAHLTRAQRTDDELLPATQVASRGSTCHSSVGGTAVSALTVVISP